MYCNKCGTEQKSGQKFCPKCGTPFKEVKVEDANVPPSPAPASPTENHEASSNGYKSVSVLLGIAIVVLGAILGIKHLDTDSIKESLSESFTTSELISPVDGIPFKSIENGKWGLLRPDGTILFEDEFKDQPTIAFDGRFMVRNGNGLWEIFTATENPQKVGDEYVSIGNFYDGIAPAVKKNEHISLIDKDGNVVAVLAKSGSKPITQMENFHYGYALFEVDGAVGIVNTKGDILLEARKYFKIYHVAPNRFLALDIKYKDVEDKGDYVLDVIDPVGNQKGRIKMAKYDNICVLDNGYIGVEQTADGEKLYGIIDLEGNVIMKPTHKVQGLSDYNDGMYIFYDGEALGIRNINNEVVIRAKYDGIVWATEDMFWGNTAVDGRQGWSLVDLDGNKITKDTYLEALPFYDGENAFVQITDNTWGMINKKGEELKNVPDIYTVEDNTADDVIVSDFFDIDAIVSAVNMTPSGFGGFAIYMRPLEILKVYNENCDDGAKIELNPKDAHVDKLSYKKQILKGIEMKAELYYSEYMTEIGESYYDNTVDEWIQHPAVWTNDQPQYIKVTVSGPKLEGKTDMLYKKLLVKVKSYGKVYKENDHACIVLRKNNTGIVLVNTGSEVWAMVKSKDLASSEYIEKYSEERTYRDPAFD